MERCRCRRYLVAGTSPGMTRAMTEAGVRGREWLGKEVVSRMAGYKGRLMEMGSVVNTLK